MSIDMKDVRVVTYGDPIRVLADVFNITRNYLIEDASRRGTLSMLETVYKSDLVGAINEINKALLELGTKGEPNGYASLDENGKLPVSQLPNLGKGEPNGYASLDENGKLFVSQLPNLGKGEPNGYASLDENGKVPNAQLPEIADPSKIVYKDGTVSMSLLTIGERNAAFGVGKNSFAQGLKNAPSGNSSHAEGTFTLALGIDSHAEGFFSIAGDVVKIGIQPVAAGNSLIITDVTNLALLEVDSSIILIPKANSFAIDPTLAAVKVLSVDTPNKAITIDKNISYEVEHIVKINTTSTKWNQHSEGLKTIASATNSHAEGFLTTASGANSHAEGYSTVASAPASHSEGNSTTANGYASHAEGSLTRSSGNGSHSQGISTIALGIASHAEGTFSISGDVVRIDITAVSTGNTLVVANPANTSLLTVGASVILVPSSDNLITTQLPIATITALDAPTNTATIDMDIPFEIKYIVKINNSASKWGQHSEGLKTIASGANSHAEGFLTTASGYQSHAEGNKTIASGDNAHTEGAVTIASGFASHAEGQNTVASGYTSHVEGYGTVANVWGSHVSGLHNKPLTGNPASYLSTADAMVIGNGTSTAASNAFRVTFAGAVLAKAAYNSTGADYSEYFEWLDGNPNSEDRVGFVVTLDGDKIRKATVNDTYLLGIVSATPSIIGDSHQDDWQGKYLLDEWGRIQYHWVDVVYEEYQPAIFNELSGQLEEQPTKQVTRKEYHPIHNPHWDNNEEYIPRDKRPEWSAIGLMGKLYVRDDGTCMVNGFVKVGSIDGTLTHSAEPTNMRVMQRMSDNIIKVFIK